MFSPSSPPSFLRSGLLILGLANTPLLSASPQDLRDFDQFIHHVRKEAASGVPERIADCFSPFLQLDPECAATPTMELLGKEAQRFGWKALGQDIARFADGFVLVDTDGTMTNLHARAKGQQHLLEILGNRVKFRREAGASGEVIAVLDMGVLPGRTDAGRWAVNRDGMEWTPVVLDHPEFGKVRGYIGSDYVRSVKGHGDLVLTAAYDGTRWALTGFERNRTDLGVSCCGPRP